MAESILIVDDDRALADIIRDILSAAGYAVKHVKDADSAFAEMKKKPVDLVLLDFNLKGISGLELLRLMKQEPKTATLPVMMLTVKGDEFNKVKCLTAGADDYLVKPASTRELLARVQALLRRSR